MLAGPITGFVVSAIGWPKFFLATMAIGIPGLVMLGRFVPLGVREPDFEREAVPTSPVMTAIYLRTGLTAGAVLAVVSALLVATLDALDARRANTAATFDMLSALWRVIVPTAIVGWVQLAGIVAFSAVGGMFIAAFKARRK